ncbi:MAG: efflux RND transporter permease subunit, partial [Bacteroidota bacterium]
DQALSVSIGLASSLLVSITLLPTLFRLIYKKNSSREKQKAHVGFSLYEKSLDWVFRYPLIFLGFILAMMTIGGIILKDISIRQLPEVAQQELQLELDWNEDLEVDSQIERVRQMGQDLSDYYIQLDAQIGTQNFLLNPEPDKGLSELKIYMEAKDPLQLTVLRDSLSSWLNQNHLEVPFSITPPPTIFERLFANRKAAILLKLSKKGSNEVPELSDMYPIMRDLEELTAIDLQAIPEKSLRIIEADLEKLAIYQVDIRKLYQKLQTDFRSNQIISLLDQKKEIPVLISGAEVPIADILSMSQVENEEGVLIPINALIEVKRTTTYTSIFGGRVGTFVPIAFEIGEGERAKVEEAIRELSATYPAIDFYTEGALYEGKESLIELSVIILIALLMLYFILAAQFESLLQPLIVLLEVPIDLAAAIIFLWLGASSLNLMSMIGMIVMSGIIINDSILKIDTINQLRRDGLDLMEAIHEGGKRRLIPIIMTSLTTILAVVPFFFGSGLGLDLQKPLALALIGGMMVGTIVSLFFIPLVYYYTSAKVSTRSS